MDSSVQLQPQQQQIFSDNEPLIPEHTRQAAKAVFIVLIYSFLMFTLPFGSFFATKYVLIDGFSIEGYTNTVWSVIAAVVTVNLLIVGYAYHAYHDPEYNDQGELISEGDDDKIIK